ncbi:DUF3987 domain-containing protein [Sediminibacterium sp.]|uniref:DUF3987 domain-containing protein n=1 Tax=Sediminibacterium sp. TaxID=1917865 RepID=UPI003F726570
MSITAKRSNKESVLLQSNGGFDFYKFVIPELELANDYNCKPTYNPFYKDTKPGLSVYFNPDTERWMFNDFGNEDFKGDVFSFAANYYELDVKKNFFEILKLMANDLELEFNEKRTDSNVINIFGFKLQYKGKDGYADSYRYFKQFGITESVLRQYKVKAIESCDYITKDGDQRTRFFKELAIAYEDVYFSKIYTPHPKGFFYVGSKEKDFVFGFKQVFARAHKAKAFPDTLILTGGEKDVLTLTSLGYDAISLNSETAAVPKHLTADLFNAYKNIVIMYDNDVTGKRRSENIHKELCKSFKTSICNLPEVIAGYPVKDVSDYMKVKLPVGELHQLIKDSVLRVDEIKSDVVSEIITDVVHFKQEVPVLPDWLYAGLPQFLKGVSLQFSDPIERDLILLSTLGVTSSLFPNVRGYYGHGKVAANLYVFISAPASAGKGLMKYAKRLGSKINQYLKVAFRKEYSKYLADKAYYEANVKGNPDLEKPVEPEQKALFIPANTSISKMIQLLCTNENFGIIFETEGDALAEALQTDWGNFSTVLRKATHHETVSMARRQNNEMIEVENPCLSTVLSGTPDQIQRLVQSIENGLTSRFCFYDFKSDIVWKDQFAIPNSNRELFFDAASDYMLELWEKQLQSTETIIRMPEEQTERINVFFSEKLKALHLDHGDDIVASIRRHGLIFYRIAMLLTIFRHLEDNEWLPEVLYVSKKEVDAALVITETLLIHLVSVFKRLEGSVLLSKLNSRQRGLFEALPEAFSKKQYTEIRKVQGIKDDAAEKYIGDFIKHGAINRVDQGQYRKVA